MKHTPTPLGCPFCGSTPEIGHAKITHCSLHGDPAREVHFEIFASPSGRISLPTLEKFVKALKQFEEDK